MDLGGGTPTIFGITLSLASQDFNVYDGTATTDQIGSITTNDEVTNLLGLTNTEFTVTDATPLGDTPLADLPTEGTVYDVLNLGGLENVYTAIPGVDGGADTITDTLVTPFGNVDLSSLFAGIGRRVSAGPGCCVWIRSRRGHRGGHVRGLRNRPAGFPGSVEVLHNQTSQVLRGLGCLALMRPAR